VFNYYINSKLIESWPKGSPRKFRFGETHYIEVSQGVELKDTKVINDKTDISDYSDYDYISARKQSYGSLEEQIEFIAENGVSSFRSRQLAIKSMYPKTPIDSTSESENLKK